MQNVKRKSKELDHYLKAVINSVPDKLKEFTEMSTEPKMTYYTGNWLSLIHI